MPLSQNGTAFLLTLRIYGLSLQAKDKDHIYELVYTYIVTSLSLSHVYKSILKYMKPLRATFGDGIGVVRGFHCLEAAVVHHQLREHHAEAVEDQD